MLRRIISQEKAGYRKLFDAAQQLLAIVKKYREGANKDIRRFTEDIEKLCRRWDK